MVMRSSTSKLDPTAMPIACPFDLDREHPTLEFDVGIECLRRTSDKGVQPLPVALSCNKAHAHGGSSCRALMYSVALRVVVETWCGLRQLDQLTASSLGFARVHSAEAGARKNTTTPRSVKWLCKTSI
eukprot:TRINITY_DN11223_c0_g2_i1.p3 TRINITY_DN11223_c0_g2~~TRINITY_DN11223_c0_g2_i1.p3  ORF type:complete len:128 (-),score=6.33 TRINITY_DN11223_c0_g2_i1:2507-2890(-)